MLTLSQTGLHIPISDGLNYQVYFNNSVDDSFLTHLNLRVKLNAILANNNSNNNNNNNNNNNSDNSGGGENRNNRHNTRTKYCWSYGAAWHTGVDYRYKKDGHQDSATMENRKGGCTNFCQGS